MRDVKTINNNHAVTATVGRYEAWKLLMHTNRRKDTLARADGGEHAHADTHRRTHTHNSLLAFKTKVLIIITHIHTNAEHGWAGGWCACGTRQRDTLTPRRSLYCCCHSNQGQVVQSCACVRVRACTGRNCNTLPEELVGNNELVAVRTEQEDNTDP